MKEASLQVKALKKRYPGFRGESMKVFIKDELLLYPGQILWLFGASGSGKSTFLNLISGIEEASFGEVRLKGERIQSGVPEFQRAALRRCCIGYAFQSTSVLFEELTLLENLQLALRFKPFSEDKIQRNSAYWLEFFGLTEASSAYPGQLSGGERRRLLLARTLASEAEILLFDEPTCGLDAGWVQPLERCVERLAKEEGRVVLWVSHQSPAFHREALPYRFQTTGSS